MTTAPAQVQRSDISPNRTRPNTAAMGSWRKLKGMTTLAGAAISARKKGDFRHRQVLDALPHRDIRAREEECRHQHPHGLIPGIGRACNGPGMVRLSVLCGGLRLRRGGIGQSVI